MTSALSTQDYRLSVESAAANAPEVDYALVAPELREGDCTLEVCAHATVAAHTLTTYTGGPWD